MSPYRHAWSWDPLVVGVLVVDPGRHETHTTEACTSCGARRRTDHWPGGQRVTLTDACGRPVVER